MVRVFDKATSVYSPQGSIECHVKGNVTLGFNHKQADGSTARYELNLSQGKAHLRLVPIENGATEIDLPKGSQDKLKILAAATFFDKKTGDKISPEQFSRLTDVIEQVLSPKDFERTNEVANGRAPNSASLAAAFVEKHLGFAATTTATAPTNAVTVSGRNLGNMGCPLPRSSTKSSGQIQV